MQDSDALKFEPGSTMVGVHATSISEVGDSRSEEGRGGKEGGFEGWGEG